MEGKKYCAGKTADNKLKGGFIYGGTWFVIRKKNEKLRNYG